jgi:uncharacterized RDD family membrane protein YckC
MPGYGGFWRRTLAYILDGIVVNIGVSIISFSTNLIMGVGMRSAGSDSALILASTTFTGAMLGLTGSWLYFALMESSSHQATVGKLALGLIVTDDHGRRIGFGRATGRYFAKIISAMILFVGFFMVGWTNRKQGLHDIIASTLVYKSRSPHELIVDVEAFR